MAARCVPIVRDTTLTVPITTRTSLLRVKFKGDIITKEIFIKTKHRGRRPKKLELNVLQILWKETNKM